MKWLIVYSDKEFFGETKEEWEKAPSTDVQAIARWPRQEAIRWTCDGKVVTDRDLWTGLDMYNPFDWGVKFGRLIDRDLYDSCWRRACGDH